MLPYYCTLFLTIYVKRIKHLEDFATTFCIRYDMFMFKFKMPVLEQTLFYMILTCLFCMITAIKSSISSSQDEDTANTYFINLFKRKLLSKNPSLFWLASFHFLKHVQTIIFIWLFFHATNNIK
jgi:hypothetical protein